MECMACMLASASAWESWADIFDMSCAGMVIPFISEAEFCWAKQNAPVRQSKANSVFIIGLPTPYCTNPASAALFRVRKELSSRAQRGTPTPGTHFLASRSFASLWMTRQLLDDDMNYLMNNAGKG